MKESDKRILGGFLMGWNLEYIAKLRDEDFDVESLPVYRCIRSMYADDTLLKLDGTPDLFALSKTSKTPVSVLGELVTNADTMVHISTIMDRISGRRKRAAVLYAQGKISSDELMASLAVDDEEPEQIRSLSEILLLDLPEEMERRKNGRIIPFGIKNIDESPDFPKIVPGNLLVIAARPGVGKTAFSFQMAENAARNGFKVLYFPLEMTDVEMGRRTIRRRTNIDAQKINSGNLEKEDYEKISILADAPGYSSNLYLLEGVRYLSKIRASIKKYKPDIVFLDQLSQIEPEVRTNNIREKFVYITKNLKAMALKMNVPIVLIAQLNRDASNGSGEEAFKLPSLSNLKESGSIEEDADYVLLIQTAKDVETIRSSSPSVAEVFDKYKTPFGAIPAVLVFDKARDSRKRVFGAWFQGSKFAYRPLNIKDWD